MKFTLLGCIFVGSAVIGACAWVGTFSSSSSSQKCLQWMTSTHQPIEMTTSRNEFIIRQLIKVGGVTTAVTALSQQPAWATGRATLDVMYRRYAPRIRAGGEFYQGEFKTMVKNNDWKGIQAALRDVPERKKKDLTKADAGVAERARQAGGFSDARVLVAADLFASGFSSQNSVSEKTKKMKAAVEKVRTTMNEIETVTKQALGEDKGGFFGFGKKKMSEAELSKQMKTLYAEGGNAWNEYISLANENLALQFDRFEYVQ